MTGFIVVCKVGYFSLNKNSLQVDILLDNNVPFSHDGVFELTDEDNAVIASAGMIIDNPKIAIDPFDENDKAVFEQKGYKTISQEEFTVELIK